MSDIYLHHRGEPLMNPALFDMIAYARSAGIRTRFHTNGTMLNEERARKLIEASPDLVSFSIDGFQKDIYERVRVGARFENTIGNIRRFLEMRRQMKRRRPYVVIERIRFSHSDVPEAVESIRALAQEFRDAGADEVIVKEEYVWAEETAAEAPRSSVNTVCTFPWYSAVICWDGTVTPCPQDFHAKMKLGNVREQSLRDVWNGPAYRDHRRRLCSDLGSLALCRKCDRLQRKTTAGAPLQYLRTFLTDQLVGYNRLRKWIGTAEKN